MFAKFGLCKLLAEKTNQVPLSSFSVMVNRKGSLRLGKVSHPLPLDWGPLSHFDHRVQVKSLTGWQQTNDDLGGCRGAGGVGC